MRISDEERREVAENLRHLDDETVALIDERMHCLTNEEIAKTVVLNIGLCKAIYVAGLDVKTLGDFWDLLADLIDPTCEMTPQGEGFRCSACGTYHDMSGFDEFPWPRCPECGARVKGSNSMPLGG